MKPALHTIHNQPSWRFASASVEAHVTRLGGHLAPVTFTLPNGRKIQPYAIAPWAAEKLSPATPAIIRALRGDFFCLPFGGNDQAFHKERHPVHGETANAHWHLESLARRAPVTGIHLSLHTRTRPGRVDKLLDLVDAHRAIYSRHVLSGFRGPMCLGHHATLKFPDEPGAGLLSFSPFRFAQVYINPTETPEKQGYSLLEPGAIITDLTRVPTIIGQTADLTRYPARRGFEDIVILCADPKLPFAWSAVTFPKQRYVWLALKDPRILASTLLWHSNGGRYYAPWSGRHVNVLGMEEVTAFFHEGLAPSARPNSLSRRGIATHLTLSPTRPLLVNYIMAVAPIPPRFDQLARVEPADNALALTLLAHNGQRATLPLDLSFLHHTRPF